MDFLAVSSRSHLRNAVEPKVCEYCGENFWRPVPELAKLGQKTCPGCQKQVDELAAAREAKKPVRRVA